MYYILCFSGMQKHKFGNSNVQYGPDGRLVTGREGTFPRTRDRYLPYDGDYRSYDAHREKRKDERREYDDRRGGYDDRREGYDDRRGEYENWGEGENDDNVAFYDDRGARNDNRNDKMDDYSRRDNHGRDQYPSQFGQGNYDTQTDWNTTKKDWHQPTSKDYNYDKTGMIANQNYWGDQQHKKHSTDYDDGPFGIVFIVNGILLLICAIINIILCTEHHYYCGFWAGIVVLEFGVVGVLHKGDYFTKWKVWFTTSSNSFVCVSSFNGSTL